MPQALVLLLVVVDHRLEEGEARRPFNQFDAILLPAHQLAVEAREAQGKAAAAQGQREALVRNLQCSGVGIGKGLQLTGRCLQLELVLAQLMLCRTVASGGGLDDSQLDEGFPLVEGRQRQLQLCGGAGSHPFQADVLARQQFAFRLHLDQQADVVQVGEPVAVFQLKLAARQIQRPHLDRAEHLLVFPQARPRGLIRVDEAIHAEVVVVGIVAVVTAVLVDGAPLLVLIQNAVIAPLPDVVALDMGMAVEHLLIFGETPRAVAHGMGVFTEDARLGHRELAKAVHLGDAGVHGAHHVHHLGVAILFVVHQTGRVDRLAALVHGPDVAAVAGLVAQRPDDDGGVVLLGVNVAFDTIHEHRLPERIVGDAAEVADIGKAVGLHVSLRHHEQTVLVAQLVEARVVRVVGGAHRVEVVLLHQHDVALHPVHADGAALEMVVVVTVHPVQLEIAAVDVEEAVLDLDLAHPDPLRDHLQQLPLSVVEGEHQLIEVGILGAPQMGVGQIQREAAITLAVDGEMVEWAAGDLAALIQQWPDQTVILGRLAQVFELDITAQGGALAGNLVVIRQRGLNEEVLHMDRRFAHQVDVAEDPRHPPHVLIFNVSGVGPLHYPHREQVLAGFGIGADVEFGGEAAPLAEANVVAVYIDFEVSLHPVKLDDHLLAVPGLAQHEAALIGAGGVVGRHEGHIDGEGKTLVGVLQLAMPFHLPHVGHSDLAPIAHGAVIEGLRHLQGMVEIVELPLAAQGEEAAAQLALHGGRQPVVGIREEVGARGQPVFTNEVDVFPVIHMSSRNKTT